MNTLKEFKDKLTEDSVEIKGEQVRDGINILTINNLPESVKKITSNSKVYHQHST